MDNELSWEIRQVPVGGILVSYLIRIGDEKPEVFASTEGVLGTLLGSIVYRQPDINFDDLYRIMSWTVHKLDKCGRANSKLMYGEGVLDGQMAETEGARVREVDSDTVQEAVS